VQKKLLKRYWEAVASFQFFVSCWQSELHFGNGSYFKK